MHTHTDTCSYMHKITESDQQNGCEEWKNLMFWTVLRGLLEKVKEEKEKAAEFYNLSACATDGEC